MKRSLKILFCLSLLLFVLGVGNISASADETYYVWVGKTQAASYNKDYIPGRFGGYAEYDPDTKTLTFHDFVDVEYDADYLVFAKDDLTIKGNAVFKERANMAATNLFEYGIYTSGKLTVSGNFSIQTHSVALYGEKGVVITGKDTIVDIKGNVDPCIGIESKGTVEINDGMALCMSTCSNGYGVYAPKVLISGGEFDVFMEGSNADGIYCDKTGTINITGGTISIWTNNRGMIAGDIDITGGDIVTGGPYVAIGAYKSLTVSDKLDITEPVGGHVTKYNNEYFISFDDETPATQVEISKKYPVWIGETQVTSANKNRIYGKNGGYVSYDPDTKTLTFYDFKDIDGESMCLVSADEDLTIKGKASFTEPYFMSGITTEGVLTVSGNFDILADDHVLHGTKGVVITGKDTVVKTTCEDEHGECITSFSGKVEIKDGKVSCYSIMDEATGIRGKEIILSGGTVDVSVERWIGIYSIGKISIKGGKLYIKANEGIIADEIEFTGGETVVEGGVSAIEATSKFTISSDLAVFDPLNGKIARLYGKYQILDSENDQVNDVRIAKNPITITMNPSDTAVEEGKLSYFAVKATGTNLKYLWQYKETGMAFWEDWESKTTATISVAYAKKRDGMKLRCVITDASGISVTSGEAELTYTAASSSSFAITEQPKDATVAENELAYFSIKAKGEGLKYLWQYKEKGKTTWTDWTSKTTADINVAYLSSRNGMSLRCKVTNKDGKELISNVATLTYTSASVPTITEQPKNASVKVGELAYFGIKAKGDGLTYLWQYKEKGKSTWTDWTTKKTADISVAYSSSRNGMSLRCVVTDKNGKKVTSNEAVLTYTSTSTFAITGQPKNTTVNSGELAYFSVKAQGEGLKYLWQYKEKGKSTWTDWNTKTTADISVAYSSSRNGMSLRCVVTDKNGNKLTSNEAVLTYTTALKITTQPVSSTVNKNTIAYFGVKAEGKGLKYLWQYKLAGDSSWTDWNSKTTADISVAYAAYRNNMQL
ncbi:MAG: carbohydrate-binding domain-containing protein, partial [Lachnospiraceae bacterium]|nr:carbohydrate-binding domain-containing protein [Lachnospiraceae bacterium]